MRPSTFSEPPAAWSASSSVAPPAAVRVLVYGMQSSGATLFTTLLGQHPDALVVPDLWALEVAPPLPGFPFAVVKATVGTVPFEAHEAQYRPTHRVLLLRHPVDVVESLSRKSYRDYGGTLAYKLAKADATFATRGTFDAVVHYEELFDDWQVVARRLARAGIPVDPEAPRFERSPQRIVAEAQDASAWCRDGFRARWGLGNLDLDALDPLRRVQSERSAEARRLAGDHAPLLTEYYARRDARTPATLLAR